MEVIMNKKAVLLGFVMIIGLVVFYLTMIRTTSVSKLVDVDDVDRIYIMNGNTGEQIEISELDDINLIKNYMNNLDVSRKIKLPSGGYEYYLDFYNEENHLTRITFAGDELSIDDRDYKIESNKNELSISELISNFILNFSRQDDVRDFSLIHYSWRDY